MDTSQPAASPWYREFWAWFVIAILVMGVASGTGILVIGIGNAPQMVTGDYRPLGKALVDTHRRADQAEALGLSARLDVGSARAEIALEADRPGDLPEQLLLRFEHPTDTGRDVSVVARRSEEGLWQAGLESVQPPERARVIVSDLEQSWWLAGRFDGAANGRIGLAPERL